MKRYLVSVEGPAFGDIEKAIEASKDCVSLDDRTYYIYELVGAVHPGKPRWRPTERKERVEKPSNELRDYKIKITSYPIDRPVPLVNEIRALTGYNLKHAKDIVDGHTYLEIFGLAPSRFLLVKASLEALGATIEYKIS